MPTRRIVRRALAPVLLLLTLSACGDSTHKVQSHAAPPPKAKSLQEEAAPFTDKAKKAGEAVQEQAQRERQEIDAQQ